ncbi:MAG: GNAT family N-acetyltransferase [Spirochaetaceae bacterium]|jgi:GNAT superfamily N-acetyltransferase|nr:GNAT family N-acetyltransferase [Spirochaetaceae bacterium]
MEFRLMDETDFNEVVGLMVKAFFPSTLYTWVAPDQEERHKILTAMFRYRVRGWIEEGREVQLALEGGRVVGSATWLQPTTAVPQPRGSLEEVIAGLSPLVVERWSLFQPVIEAQEKAILQPAWELAPIAVLPEMQGKKIGAALINQQLSLLDHAGLPCYLCTQDRNNLAIYERFGFRKEGELLIAPGGPMSHTMKRDVHD